MSETSTLDQSTIIKWLNQPMRIRLTDGREVVGTFLCTDPDCNIILGQTREYAPDTLSEDESSRTPTTNEEPRQLGLTMVPGRHIVSISVFSSPREPPTNSHTSDECNNEPAESV